MKLANKIALITGAGSGLGRAAARLFASEGAAIAAADIDLDAANQTAAEINAAGGKAIALRVDVSNEAEVRQMVNATLERLGVPDVLYNNAGTIGRSDFLANMEAEMFDRVIAVNLRGVFLGLKHTLPHMARRGSGSVINQASAAGLVGIRGSAAYCASKAGVIALTKVAALEYARYKIRVNCICPGLIDTPMAQELRTGELDPNSADTMRRISPFGRMGTPEEISRTALFLASDDSTYATGATFVIDGGWTAS
ncbi:MAG TPA: SDR family NAD(P)-dependent oxidoreductase [Candidatus Binataceae bacterium]|nr:SDR family NAD(P)-dependent oxidoreductase [Candidatus Binataceae bacterium]